MRIFPNESIKPTRLLHIIVISSEKQTLPELFSLYNQKLSERKEIEDLSDGRFKRFNILYNKCADFKKYKFKKSDIPLDEVKLNYIVELEHYLRTVKLIGYNTAMKYMRDLKQVIKYGVMLEYIPSNPTGGVDNQPAPGSANGATRWRGTFSLLRSLRPAQTGQGEWRSRHRGARWWLQVVVNGQRRLRRYVSLSRQRYRCLRTEIQSAAHPISLDEFKEFMNRPRPATPPAAASSGATTQSATSGSVKSA
jgi:hypothetical protein